MSSKFVEYRRIEGLNPDELANVLEINGYGECCDVIRKKSVDGATLLNLTEVQLALWGPFISLIHIRRLWSFVKRIKDNPQELIMSDNKTSWFPRTYTLPDIPIDLPLPPTQLPVPPSLINDMTNFQEYLTPITVRPKQPLPIQNDVNIHEEEDEEVPQLRRGTPNNSSFLKKYQDARKFSHLESRHKSVENPYTAPPKNRPLPVPPETDSTSLAPSATRLNINGDNTERSTVDSARKNQSPTAISLHQAVPPIQHTPFNRPLPPIPTEGLPVIDNPLTYENFSKSGTLPKQPASLPKKNFHTNKGEVIKSYEDESDQVYYTEIDLKREICYRDTDRKGARRLLQGLSDGTYLIRPSRQDHFICIISIIYRNQMFNVGVESGPNYTLRCKSARDDNQPVYYTVSEIVSYFSSTPLQVIGNDNELHPILLKNVLPPDRR